MRYRKKPVVIAAADETLAESYNGLSAAIMRGHANIADAAAADLRAAGIPATTLEGIALAWRASADSLDSTPVFVPAGWQPDA